MSNSQRPPSRLGVFFQDYWTALLAVLGPLSLALSNVWQMAADGKWKWTYGSVTIAGVIMSLLGGIGQVVRTPGNKTLQISLKKSEEERGRQSQNNERSFRSTIRNELLTLSNILQLADSECISLYYAVGGKLVMLGQYSGNTQLDTQQDVSYPYEKEFLETVWIEQNGNAFNSDFPAIGTIQSLGIRSKTICMRPIRDIENRKVAALVFKSVCPNAFTERTIDDVMNQGFQAQRMLSLINTWGHLIPDPNIASREGV